MSAVCTCGQPALLQCLCQTPPTSFCSECLPLHVFRTAGVHKQQPVSLVEGEKAGQSLGLVRALQAGLEEGRTAQSEAIQALNQLISSVHNYKLSVLRYSADRLKVLERVVNRTVQEISHYQTHPAMVPSPQLQSLLLLSEGELSSKLRFVTLTHSPTSSWDLLLHKTFDMLISTQLPALTTIKEPVKYLPLLNTPTFYVTMPPFNKVSSLEIENLLAHNNYTLWCYLPGGNFMATGEQESKSTVSIDCANKFAFPLKETIDEHHMGGIILVDYRVYLLGGLRHSKATTTVEVYDIYEDRWMYLNDMLVPRWGFQPSYYERFIYIFGGAQNSEISERLNLDENSSEQLSLSLPSGYITSLCSLGDFYIFLNGEIYVWEGGSEVRQVGKRDDCSALSYLSPVLTEGVAYFFGLWSDQEHLMKFDLSSQRLGWCLA